MTTARKAPAKKAPAKKVAATRRTTVAKPKFKAGSFDAKRDAIIKKKAKAAGSTTSRWAWHGYGRDWLVKVPNIALVAELLGTEDQLVEGGDEVAATDYLGYLSNLTRYACAHIDESQREDFLRTMLDDEEFDEDVLNAIIESITEAISEGIPT